jgi:hypothetical protein
MIQESIISNELMFLSSAWFEGRKTGERGNEMAADYLSLYFREIGLEPVQWNRPSKMASEYTRGDNRSLLQQVPLFRCAVSEADPLTIVTQAQSGERRTEFRSGSDFSCYDEYTSNNVDIHAPVVFAGYGISMPDKGYDDFAGIDLTGKIAVVSMGYPGYRDTTSAGYIKMKENNIKEYSRWNKLEAAKKRGAEAVLFLYTTTEWYDPAGRDYHNYTYGEKTTEKPEPYFEFATDSLILEVPFLTISQRVGHELFQGSGVDLAKFDSKTAKDCKPASTVLKGKSVELKISRQSELIRSCNIIGCIPGENSNEFIVVGAHYDHIGKTADDIYYGSDDNASGTVAVMAIARACREMKAKPRRTIIFALWTAEEEGLLGSRYFVDKWKDGKIKACLNFDMISRYNPKDSTNYLNAIMSKDFTGMKKSIALLNQEDSLGLNILYAFQDAGEGNSDYASFGEKGIPFCEFFTGFHPDYHEKSDTYEKGNIEAMTRIISLGFRAVWLEANRNE